MPETTDRNFAPIYRTNELFRVRAFGRNQPVNHAEWMAQNNPLDWPPEKWRAFERRMYARGLYAQRVHAIRSERHAWAEQRVVDLVGSRKVPIGMRHQMRREANREAEQRLPYPDPMEGDDVLA